MLSVFFIFYFILFLLFRWMTSENQMGVEIKRVAISSQGIMSNC